MTLHVTMTNGAVYEVDGDYGKPSLLSRIFPGTSVNFYNEHGELVFSAMKHNIYHIANTREVKQVK